MRIERNELLQQDPRIIGGGRASPRPSIPHLHIVTGRPPDESVLKQLLSSNYVPPYSLKRVDGWADRLAEVVDRNQEALYQFGKWDCVFAVAAAIEAVTGHHFSFDYFGLEESQNFKRAAGGSLADVWGHRLGQPVEGATGAIDGDIGVVFTVSLTSVFIFDGAAWGTSVVGFRRYAIDRLVAHWRVGDPACRAVDEMQRPRRPLIFRPPNPEKLAAHSKVIRGEAFEWTRRQMAGGAA